MNYQVTHVEFDITDVPDVKGYQASQWLTFIIPINLAQQDEPEFDEAPLQQSLGRVDIPVVLRNYPTPPTLTKQEGVPVSVKGDTTKERLEKASEWDFKYSYTEDQAAQDQLYSDITFNAIPSLPPVNQAYRITAKSIKALQAANVPTMVVDKLSALKGTVFVSIAHFDAALQELLTDPEFAAHRAKIYAGSLLNRDLFDDMAQFITVWPQVSADLTQYLATISPSTKADDPNLGNAFFAMEAMVQITNNLALAWKAYIGLAGFTSLYQESDSARSYDFLIQQKEDPYFTTQCTCNNNEECKRLVVSIVPPNELSSLIKDLFQEGSIVEIADLPQTPVVDIAGYTRAPATDETGKEIPNSYWYFKMEQGAKVYLGYLCSFEIPGRTIDVDELNVLQFQHAWAGIAVIRNENLVPNNPTIKDFIYHTPLIRYSNKLIPLLYNNSSFNIAKIENESGSNLPLATHLANFFQTFFTYNELAQQTVKISASWNYYLPNKASSPLPAIQLPVLLFPPFSFEIPGDYELPVGGCSPAITSDTPFICQMAAALEAWYKEKMPITTDAYFQFDLSVFSALSEAKLPLIELPNLVLPYTNINNL